MSEPGPQRARPEPNGATIGDASPTLQRLQQTLIGAADTTCTMTSTGLVQIPHTPSAQNAANK